MLVLLAYHYYGFLRETISFFPNHLLSAIFCVVTMIAYPLCIFETKTGTFQIRNVPVFSFLAVRYGL